MHAAPPPQHTTGPDHLSTTADAATSRLTRPIVGESGMRTGPEQDAERWRSWEAERRTRTEPGQSAGQKAADCPNIREMSKEVGGVGGTRTRGLRRDRPAF